jgi:hypothetical protein
VEALSREIEVLGRGFADRVPPLLTRALDRAMEHLVSSRAEWFNDLKPDAVSALRRSVKAAIDRGAQEVRRRLQEPDLWLHPTIEHARGPDERLDDHNHRAWVAILNGADALDPVLNEFGLPPGVVPDPGGGHYGLQPQRLGELDPSGTLGRLWRRYVGLYEQYREALRRIPEERRARDRDEALRRWREPE